MTSIVNSVILSLTARKIVMVYLTLKFFYDFISKLDFASLNADELELLKSIEFKIMLTRNP